MVDAAYVAHAVLFADVTDVDIVVPRGSQVAQLTIGRFNPKSVTQRIRIRGTSPGMHSGGVVGAITFHSSPTTDVIIDGVDLNGADGKNGAPLWHFSGDAERIAIVNVRGHSVDGATLNRRAVDLVIAGTHIVSANGYGIRGGDRIVVYDSRIDGISFHRVRVHPRPGPPQYAWIADNTFVDPREARIFNAFDIGDGSRYAAVWAICNRVYAYSTCHPPSFQARDATYAVLTNNQFFGSIHEAGQRATQSAEGPGRDYLTGNTYAAWQKPPPWGKLGDPAASIPLVSPPAPPPSSPSGRPCLLP